jgi:aminoglycoside 6'-N-acetyltransferase I
MSPSIRIRETVPADWTDCASFFREVFNAPPWNEDWSEDAALQRLADCARTPHFLGLIAEDGAAIMALAFGYWQRYQEERHFFLLELCVATDRQREGIGADLLAELHRRLQAEGVNRIYTLTARDTPAQDFYAKEGFYLSPKMVMMARRY